MTPTVSPLNTPVADLDGGTLFLLLRDLRAEAARRAETSLVDRLRAVVPTLPMEHVDEIAVVVLHVRGHRDGRITLADVWPEFLTASGGYLPNRLNGATIDEFGDALVESWDTLPPNLTLDGQTKYLFIDLLTGDITPHATAPA